MGRKIPGKGWLIIVGGLLATAAMMIAIQLVPLQLGFISESLHLDNSSASLIISTYGLTSGVSAFIWGFVADRFGVRRAMTTAGLVIGVFAIIFGLAADNFVKALIFYGIVGIGAAGVFNSTLSKLVGAWFYPDMRGRAMSLITPGSVLTGMLLGAMVPSLSKALGWHETSVMLGVIAVVFSLVIFAIVRDKPSERDMQPIGTPVDEHVEAAASESHPLRQVLAMPITWHMGIMYILWQGGYLVVSGFMAKALIDAGAGVEVAGLAVSCYSLGQLVGQQIWGPLSDRFPRKRIIAISGAIWAACAAGIAFAYGNVAAMFALIVVMGVGLGMIPVISAMFADHYPAGLRGTGAGTQCTLGAVGRTVGPVLGGMTAEAAGSLSGAFLFASGAMVLSMVITLTLPLPKGSKLPDSMEETEGEG